LRHGSVGEFWRNSRERKGIACVQRRLFFPELLQAFGNVIGRSPS